MAAGIVSMQVSQSPNQKYWHSQASQTSTTTVEKELSVRKTGHDNLTLKTDKTLNVRSTHTKGAEGEERIGDKTEEASQEPGAFIIGTNKDCFTIKEKDAQRHSEHSVGHVRAIGTLPENVLSDNQHRENVLLVPLQFESIFYQRHRRYRSIQQCAVTKTI